MLGTYNGQIQTYSDGTPMTAGGYFPQGSPQAQIVNQMAATSSMSQLMILGGIALAYLLILKKK